MAEQLFDTVSTTLAASIDASQPTLVVVSETGLPATGTWTLLIDTEGATVTSRSGATLTVTRGAIGVAATHSAGAVIKSILSARGLIQGIRDTMAAAMVRPAPVVGTTDPVTTNTATALLANPTLTITTTVTSDILVWVRGTLNDGTGGAIINYHVRVNGGAWELVATNSSPSSAGRHPLSGFHKFPAVAAGANLIEVGNSSSVANSITHYGTTRRLMAMSVPT